MTTIKDYKGDSIVIGSRVAFNSGGGVRIGIVENIKEKRGKYDTGDHAHRFVVRREDWPECVSNVDNKDGIAVLLK